MVEYDVDARLMIEMLVFYADYLPDLLAWRRFRGKEMGGLSKDLVLNERTSQLFGRWVY
jgi:hypothetical protein